MHCCKQSWLVVYATALFGLSAISAEIEVLQEHRAPDEASAAFRFKSIPPARRTDLASKAVFKVVDGQRDSNGGTLEVLHDGRLPGEEDDPRSNFFFRPGTDGGRILLDLGAATNIAQINTFSWHPENRGPQVYTVYAADGSAAEFKPEPTRDMDPANCGWTVLAKVDTRVEKDQPGGQYGVSLRNAAGLIGRYRFLLFDFHQTSTADRFSNTFLSEIDVLDASAPEEPAPNKAETIVCEDIVEVGEYRITIVTTETPDLTEWVRKTVVPMAREWYPKIVQMFPSEGFSAPQRVQIRFSQNMSGVAATGGARITCAGTWFRNNLKGEALGAIFHELVHVVQQYGRARPLTPEATRPPGWLVEGIADYTRWFTFEPESRGAEITSRNLSRARYDGNYRISANFLNWASVTYDKDLVPQLNRAIREGRYGQAVWKDRTGRDLEQLGAEWRAAMEKKVAADQNSASAAP